MSARRIVTGGGSGRPLQADRVPTIRTANRFIINATSLGGGADSIAVGGVCRLRLDLPRPLPGTKRTLPGEQWEHDPLKLDDQAHLLAQWQAGVLRMERCLSLPKPLEKVFG